MGSLTGSELLARSLASQGMDTLFFLMGGPMLETESACIQLGVRAVDTRHELKEIWAATGTAALALGVALAASVFGGKR